MDIRFHWMQRIHWPCDNPGMVQMSKALEDLGIVSVLLPTSPGGNDFMLHLPDVFRATNKIKMMVALTAYAVTPEYAARSFYSIQEYGPNRLNLNLVAGRYNDHFAKIAIDNYPGDTTLIDTHEKRVAMTEKWMEKFINLTKNEPYKIETAVVGTSETTIKIANKYTDYIFINNPNETKNINNSKPILVIDPLILDNGKNIEDVEYHGYEFTKKPSHPFSGTLVEMKEIIKNLSYDYNINDFMIHTDQKDVSQIFRLIKDMTTE